MFALYVAGIVSALIVAWVMKQFAGARAYSPLMLELPDYQWPHAGNLLLGLWERVKIFLSRVGGIILALMIVLWFLSSYPAPPEGATGPPIQYSFAGQLGAMLEYRVRAHRLQLADLDRARARASRRAKSPSSALGTVYAMSAAGDDVAGQLEPVIAQHLEPRDRLFAARLVRVRAAVPVDARGGQARNQFLALSHHHGRLSVRAGLSRLVRHVPRRRGVG